MISHRRRVRRTSLIAAGLLLAAGLPVLGFTAAAGAAAPTAVAPAAGGQASTEAQARVMAAQTGSPVTVSSETSPTQLVQVQPSGQTTATETALPVRAMENDQWVPIDTTLTQNAAGRYVPNAVTGGSVSFSAGGDNQLASMTSDSQTLNFTWPGTLPTPSAAGSTLTYANVMPGINLTVTASAAGGFSDDLIISSAQAAADPGLQTLTVGVSGNGLQLTPASGGGMNAVNTYGQTVFSSPPAQMWDSTSLPSGGVSLGGVLGSLRPDVPSATNPGLFSHQSTMTVTASSTAETMIPSQTLLTAASTKFPVFIDPTWTPHSPEEYNPAFDEVKQGSPCNAVSYYDDSGSDADNGELGVGYNGFAGSGCEGNDGAFYEFDFPAAAAGSSVISAQVNATEVYSATCAATNYDVDITATAGITSATDWNNKPGGSAAYDSSTAFGPACTSDPAGSLDGTAAAAHVASVSGTHIAFYLYEPTNISDVELKRFADNPTFVVTYDHPPAAPTALTIGDTGSSTKDQCATTTPYPYLGTSTNGYSLNAYYSDPDHDSGVVTFSYWNTATPQTVTTSASSEVSSGTTATAPMNSAFILGLSSTATTTVAYKAVATDYHANSAASTVCYVSIDKTGPQQPQASSLNYPDESTGQIGAQAGTQEPFTFSTTTTGHPVAEFVWQLQSAPSLTAPPTSEIVPASKITVAGDTATATGILITPHLFGVNTLYLYAKDTLGNPSPIGEYTFITDHTPNQSYSTLASAFNNTAISADSAPVQNGFGDGFSLSATDLTNAGWTAGRSITVDGATMTLPQYGGGASDNVVAANQTISINDPQDPNTGQYANAIVLLGFGVYSKFDAPAVPDAGAVDNVSAPTVPEDSEIAENCPTASGTDCVPTGSVTYAGSSTGDTYALEALDWSHGARDTAVFAGTKYNYCTENAAGNGCTATGSVAHITHIYAMTIPLDPNQQVTAITLPDLSSNITSTTPNPSLHILAMGLRNTTTVNAPTGQTWTGSWAEPLAATATGGSNYTIRTAIRPNTSGTTLRLKLDNALTSGPLTVTHVTVAAANQTSYTSGTPTSTPVTATFGGSQSVTIPEGTDTYSDPVTFPVTAGNWLYVSYAISNTSAVLPYHPLGGDVYTLISANSSGDHTADTTGTAFTAISAPGTSYLLTDLDVATATSTPTVAVLGDQLTTIPNSHAITTPGAATLASDLANTQPTAADGFISEGVPGELLDTWSLTDTTTPGAWARLDRDVLDQPNIGTLILTEGEQDLLAGNITPPEQTDSQDIASYLDTDAYPALQLELRDFGISLVIAGDTPCGGNSACTAIAAPNSGAPTATVDNERTTIDGWLGYLSQPGLTPGYSAGVLTTGSIYDDTPDLLGDTNTPQNLLTANDTGDHINLTAIATAAEANDIINMGNIYANASTY